MTQPDFAEAFAAALASEDEQYLEAEHALLQLPGPPAGLTERLGDDDPVARLLAQAVLEESLAAGSPATAAEEYLSIVQRWFAPTILHDPPVRGVVHNLTTRFGGQLTELMAVRLVKVPAAPVWRAQVALGYLAEHPTPAVTDVLLRYAAQTTVPALREATVRLLTASGDPNLAVKIAAERTRLAREGRDLPPELRLIT